MSSLPSRFLSHGVTLVELVVAIVVIGVALAGVMVVIVRTTSSSADPLIARQAVAIAEAYLEEALTKQFAPGPGATRPTFDDVGDYNNLNETPPHDQNDNVINALAGYSVNVRVIPEALTVVTASDAVRVQVTVTTPAGGSVVVSGYRMNYP